MKISSRYFWIFLFVVLIGLTSFGLYRVFFMSEDVADRRGFGPREIPVEIADVTRGSIDLRRTFSGTLQSRYSFQLSPKVGGRIEQLAVDISDTIHRGDLVARLENDEHLQAVAQAQADLAVAKANLVEAESALTIARREIERTTTLLERGVASDAQFDTVQADLLSREARLEVARAHLTRAEATLRTTEIRLSYANITADWTEGDEERVVAERYVDEGQMVGANTPMLLIVELDPITGIFYVTEKEYSFLKPGQKTIITTDAYPNREFEGNVARVAPVFRENSRQARIEVDMENPDGRLKPGMFIRIRVTLDHVDDAVLVPESALTIREGSDGLFTVDMRQKTAQWVPVKVGIRDRGMAQILTSGLEGPVVTLGQQLLENDSKVFIPGLNDDSNENRGGRR